MYPHRIRLRGPWDCEPLSGAAGPLRMNLPCRWAEGGLRDEKRSCVIVTEAKLGMTMRGPARRYLNLNAAYEITLTNAGTAPLENGDDMALTICVARDSGTAGGASSGVPKKPVRERTCSPGRFILTLTV